MTDGLRSKWATTGPGWLTTAAGVVFVGALVVVVQIVDLRDAWIGMIGVLAGGLVVSLGDVVRRRDEAAQRAIERADDRAGWVRERRFSAYEEALRTLTWAADHLHDSGDEDHPDLLQLDQALAAVMVYGSPSARDAVLLTPKRNEGERWVRAVVRARVALSAVVAEEVHRLAPSLDAADSTGP